ncbi:hypothetical protein D5086_016373 [Populus alba]|uniref:Uncharacterized protein n=1 Tax=Populus alba TaxID=43335 RepID=A0ACC4BUH1_POPAL
MTHQPTRIALDRTKQLAGARLGLKASREALHPQEWPIDPQGSPSDKAGPPYSGVTCYIVDRLGDRMISWDHLLAEQPCGGAILSSLTMLYNFESACSQNLQIIVEYTLLIVGYVYLGVFGSQKKANGLLNAILDLCHVFETLGCVIVVWSTRLELSQPR